MRKVLIVNINKKQAQIFIVNIFMNKKVIYSKTLKNLDAHKREGELHSDTAGRTYFSNGKGGRRVYKKKRSVDNVNNSFASRVSRNVKEILNRSERLNVVLVAEPGYLGTVRKYFKVQNIDVFKSLPKEFMNFEEKNIAGIVKQNYMYV